MTIVDREAAHQILDRWLNEVEQENGKPDAAQWVRLLAELSGQAVPDEIDAEALDRIGNPKPHDPDVDQSRLERDYHLTVLAIAMVRFAPLLPPAPRFNWGAVANDILQKLDPEKGDAPQILIPASQGRHVNIKNTARKNFVLGVIYQAKRLGISRDAMLGRLKTPKPMPLETWKTWLKLTSREEREQARGAAVAGQERPRSKEAELVEFYLVGTAQAKPW